MRWEILDELSQWQDFYLLIRKELAFDKFSFCCLRVRRVHDDPKISFGAKRTDIGKIVARVLLPFSWLLALRFWCQRFCKAVIRPRSPDIVKNN